MNSKSPVRRVQSCSRVEARRDRGDALLADHFTVGRHDRCAVHEHLVAGIDHGAVEKLQMCVKAVKAVTDLDLAGRGLRLTCK
jgi:hypothetical protein